MQFKYISISSSGGHFVQQSRTVCALMVEGISRNIYVNDFQFGPVFHTNMSIKDTSYLELWRCFVP